MTVDVRLLTPHDMNLLENAAKGVFDDAIVPGRAAEFLRDPRHVIAGAVADGVLAGMATGVIYVHPDKPAPELWINELGVAAAFQGRGFGKALLGVMFDAARAAGCRDSWVLTERSNTAARRLYDACGATEHDDASVLYEFQLAADD